MIPAYVEPFNSKEKDIHKEELVLPLSCQVSKGLTNQKRSKIEIVKDMNKQELDEPLHCMVPDIDGKFKSSFLSKRTFERFHAKITVL